MRAHFSEACKLFTLQNVIYPEDALDVPDELYFRTTESGSISAKSLSCHLGPYSDVSLNTYFNLFNVEKWRAACNLESLFVEVSGHGAVLVEVLSSDYRNNTKIVFSSSVELADKTPYIVDLTHWLNSEGQGLLYLRFKTFADSSRLEHVRFATSAQNTLSLPKLSICITTFKREDMVLATMKRLKSWLEDYELAEHMHVYVVDNGNSLKEGSSDKIDVIPNPNFGGSGGFARGLLEADEAGADYCVFMDDDAAFHMENLERAYGFLALAKHPDSALCGAMISNICAWRMWENGAWFDEAPRPLHVAMDLRDPEDVLEMQNPHVTSISIGDDYPTSYGAWWFFAFPLKGLKHYPFPFFVRGDDISFCLQNNFRLFTLNGVVSFQDDFREKESALTLYFDLRHSLIQHLVTTELQRSGLATAKIAMRFIGRSLFRFHYETALVLLQAWRDVMQGPDFFRDNIDMITRRGTVLKLVDNEQWGSAAGKEFKEKRFLTLLPHGIRRRLALASMNGQLVPFSGMTWDKIVLPIEKRSSAPEAFGATKIRFLNGTNTKQYDVQQSKLQFFRISFKALVCLIAFLSSFQSLRLAYLEGYKKYSSKSFWKQVTKKA